MLLEIFEPYILFISFFVTISVNITLIRIRASWYIIIIGNVMMTLVMNFIGLAEYDFLTQVITQIAEILIDVLGGLIRALGNALNPFS